MKIGKKIAFSVVPLALLWVVAEAALWLVGVEPALRSGDPYVGFAGEIPLFVDEVEDGVRYRRTASNKLAFFNEQRFVAEKGPDTRRVFCMGGSTTYGHPYFDPTSFCGWLRVTLPVVAPEARWEVINAGGISYASYRVAALMRQLVAEKPDYFVVYTGHNEFLEERTYGAVRDRPTWVRKAEVVLGHSRVHAAMTGLLERARSATSVPSNTRSGGEGPGAASLSAEVDAQLESSTGLDAYRRDDALRSVILERFAGNLERMIEVASSVDARIAFVVPADNVSDCSPFKSERDAGLSGADVEDFDRHLERAERELQQGRFEAARAGFADALTRSPRHAHARYGLARALRALGEDEAARTEFVRAKDEDVCPLRALSPIVETVRRTARAHAIPLVDLPAVLKAVAGDANRAAGEEWFLDHVHPTIEGHRVLGRALLAQMHAAGWIVEDPADHVAALDPAEQAHLASLDPRDHGRALKNLAKVLSWAGKTEDAARAARRALEILGEDAECLFVIAEFESLRDETESAIGYLRRATRLDPKWAKAHNNLGVELMRVGRLDEAMLAYDDALRNDPDHASARFNRGNCLRRMGRFEEAAVDFRASIERDPRDADAWFNLSRTYEDLGRLPDALEAMQRVVEIDPGDREASEIAEQLAGVRGGTS